MFTETKESGLENLMSSPSIKSEEDNNCIQHRSPGCIVGTKRLLKEEDDSTISPSKTVKTESGENDEDHSSATASSDGQL